MPFIVNPKTQVQTQPPSTGSIPEFPGEIRDTGRATSGTEAALAKTQKAIAAATKTVIVPSVPESTPRYKLSGGTSRGSEGGSQALLRTKANVLNIKKQVKQPPKEEKVS